MWFGLQNVLVSYADDASLLAHVPSSSMKPDVTESLNRDLSEISVQCNLWSLKLNPVKSHRQLLVDLGPHISSSPCIFINNTSLNSCEF